MRSSTRTQQLAALWLVMCGLGACQSAPRAPEKSAQPKDEDAALWQRATVAGHGDCSAPLLTLDKPPAHAAFPTFNALGVHTYTLRRGERVEVIWRAIPPEHPARKRVCHSLGLSHDWIEVVKLRRLPED